MRHIFFIDPLEKLNLKKDTSLYMALTAKQFGIESYLLFADDFQVSNQKNSTLNVYSFSGEFLDGGPYLKNFSKTEKKEIQLGTKDLIHMRIDPPFDARYLQYLWLLEFCKATTGAKVVNDPRGIMNFHEKLTAYALPHSVPSYVGNSGESLKKFMDDHPDEYFVLKPLDLYSGIGVEKIHRSKLIERFNAKVKEMHSPVIAQTYQQAVEQGEYRVITFKGKVLGAILKKPKAGDFISNIAHGGTYEVASLNAKTKALIEANAQKFLAQGLDLIAYDVLGETITEINTTCPGLLVEVANATQINLAELVLKSY